MRGDIDTEEDKDTCICTLANTLMHSYYLNHRIDDVINYPKE